MNKKLYWVLQMTWALPLNLIGGLAAFIFARKKAFSFHGARVAYWNRKNSSMAVGRFIFLEKGMPDKEESRVLYHEYGHTIQSVLLGPLYLPVIAFPSLFWAGAGICRRYRMKMRKSYYDFYPERWADRLGKPYCDS